ncbi:FHA domain containing protein [Musa troglodytarum]|uniref:FHA domain containing protein n=1 Tax=Musa troglodytarum TaxID=320322 RepID=A0A9E7F2Q6_9LILI|nr:FHA domain containing protein [Musa troglodytarum]
MAAAAGSRFVAFSNSKWPLGVPSLPSPSLFHQLPFNSSTHSIPPLCSKSSQIKQLLPETPKGRGITAPRSATDESSSVSSPERWLLQPAGDGDSRHIGFKVPLPDAFVIASDAVTVGRLPDKADMVIPVATVSGVHARLEKKGGTLLITDLDSTNGTYIDDKKLRPGAVTTVPPGSCITFGDTHLAMFRVSKIEQEDVTGEGDDKSEIETKADTTTNHGE